MDATRVRPLLGMAASRLQWLPGMRRATVRMVSVGLRAGVLPYRPAAYVKEPWGRGSEASDLDYIGSIGEIFRYSLLLGYITYFGGRPSILDIGCGKGHLRARMTGIDFARYMGIDQSPVAIEAAQGLADDRTRFVVADVNTFDLNGFDVIVCNEVLYYLPDPAQFLDKVRDELSPGSLLLTSMWRHGVDDYLWGLVDERFERLDLLEIRNPSSKIAKRGWRIACHRRG
jgi:SAM-dependent methyltransferase